MKKNLTPLEAYDIVAKRAQKAGMTPLQYARSKGIKNRYLLHKWKRKPTGSIRLDMAVRLGIV